MNTTKALGDRGEAAAAQYLRKRGCQLLASQWRCRYGELDLVARDRDGITPIRLILVGVAVSALFSAGTN